MPPKALLLSVSVSAALKGLCGAHQRFAGKELKAGNGIRPKPWGIVSAGSWGELLEGRRSGRGGTRLRAERLVCGQP